MIPSKLFVRYAIDLYVDLGTANTLISTPDEGVVIREPSVIASRFDSIGRRTIVAVGLEAKELMGRTPPGIKVTYPLKSGVIGDLAATEVMLRYFIKKTPRRLNLIRPRVLISIPFGVSQIEKKAIVDVARAAGARDVILIAEPIAAALGSGLPIHLPKGNMILDIGGGTTEIAVVSLFEVAYCESIRVGGTAFDEAIVELVRTRYGLNTGEPTAEQAKIQVASAVRTEEMKSTEIRGIDVTTGLPRGQIISSHDVFDAIDPLLKEIFHAASRVLEKVSPELLADILVRGVRLTGGGALIHGIAERASRELNVLVKTCEDPLVTVARGGHAATLDRSVLERIVTDEGLS